MVAKGTAVTEREKKKMWLLYQELGSFKKVAKRMRRCPSTVSRYVHEYESVLNVVNKVTDL